MGFSEIQEICRNEQIRSEKNSELDMLRIQTFDYRVGSEEQIRLTQEIEQLELSLA